MCFLNMTLSLMSKIYFVGGEFEKPRMAYKGIPEKHWGLLGFFALITKLINMTYLSWGFSLYILLAFCLKCSLLKRELPLCSCWWMVGKWDRLRVPSLHLYQIVCRQRCLSLINLRLKQILTRRFLLTLIKTFLRSYYF